MTNPIVVTQENWRKLSDHAHSKWCAKMGITEGTLEEICFLALALGGEIGELQNIVKKMWRDGQTHAHSVALGKEAADVLIYFDHFMKALGLSATGVCVAKIQELTERWPDLYKGALDNKPEETLQ